MKNTISANKVVYVTVLFTTLLSVGCASHYQVPSIVRTDLKRASVWTELDYRNAYKSGEANRKREFINPYTYNPSAAVDAGGKINQLTESFYAKASNSTTDPSSAKAMRNQLQNAIIRVSIGAVSRHLASIKSSEDETHLLLGGATLGLTGGASVAAPTASKAMAAAATGTGGFRELFTEQVFRKTLGTTIIKAIEADRAKYYSEIIIPNQKKPIADYDVEAAIKDAMEFHSRGSFYHGLALVASDAEKATSERKDKAEEAEKNNANPGAR